jgi:hypothetical protein
MQNSKSQKQNSSRKWIKPGRKKRGTPRDWYWW